MVDRLIVLSTVYPSILILLTVFLTAICLRCCRGKSTRESEDRRPLLDEEKAKGDSEMKETYGATVPRPQTPSIHIKHSVERVKAKTAGAKVEASIQPTPRPVAPKTCSPEPADTEWLSTKNLREVLNAVWPARLKWYTLGVQLGLQMVTLNIIQHNHRDNPDECMLDMIRAWLNQAGGTWKELISALNHETVGCTDVANSIVASLNKEPGSAKEVETPPVSLPESHIEYNPDSDSAYSTDSSFEYLDTSKLTNRDSIRLKARLRKDTRGIITHFSDLVLHMRRSFKQRNIDPQDVATTVKSIAGRESHTRSLMESLKLPAITSIHVLVDHLQNDNYISFINYHLVEYMISCYGTEKDKRKLSSYEAKFREYCKRSVFEVPQDVFGSVPSNGEKLAVKVRSEMVHSLPSTDTRVEENESASDIPATTVSSKNLNISLGDALFIQEKISEALHVDIGNLVLLGASRGCVELTFSVPKVIIEKVDALLEVNVPIYSKLEETEIHMLSGPPGKPQITKIRNICYRLDWTKPSHRGSRPIQHYTVSYRSVHDPPKVWKTLKTDGPTESIVLPADLIQQHEEKPMHPFIFKVQAVTNIGSGVFSEESDPIKLIPLIAPSYDHCTIARSLSVSAGVMDNHPLNNDNLQDLVYRQVE